MDDADLADVRIRSMIESAREEAAHQLKKIAVATGHCLNCGEQFREDEPHKRWCNSQCRDDYERDGPA